MARPLRMEFPGAVYHVMARGNQGQRIYADDADQLSGSVTPAPGPGQSPLVSSNLFDNMGRIRRVRLPDNTYQTNDYYATGLLKRRTGSREYPVEYAYDDAGRMKTMTTWQMASASMA